MICGARCAMCRCDASGRGRDHAGSEIWELGVAESKGTGTPAGRQRIAGSKFSGAGPTRAKLACVSCSRVHEDASVALDALSAPCSACSGQRSEAPAAAVLGAAPGVRPRRGQKPVGEVSDLQPHA